MNLPWPPAFWRRKSRSEAKPRVGSMAVVENRSRAAETAAAVATRPPAVRELVRPAIRWVGAAGRIALRPFDFMADSDAVCAFQKETYETNFPNFRYTQSFADAFRYDLRRAALDPNHALYVFDDGEVCGFLWLVICENTWTRERFGYVNNLYVAASRRSQGLGGEMMKQAEDFFRSRRVSRIRLTVTASNDSAVHLYENQGYSVQRWEMEKEL